MLQWIPSSQDQSRLIEAISLVLSNHEGLMDFLFDPRRPQLRTDPDHLIRQSTGFSSGEQLLVRVALDLWNSSGEVKLWELLKVLDQENFENVLISLQYLGTNSSYMSWKKKWRVTC